MTAKEMAAEIRKLTLINPTWRLDLGNGIEVRVTAHAGHRHGLRRGAGFWYRVTASRVGERGYLGPFLGRNKSRHDTLSAEAAGRYARAFAGQYGAP